jgi:hypothetical protein
LCRGQMPPRQWNDFKNEAERTEINEIKGRRRKTLA